jgi:hypothetical protein
MNRDRVGLLLVVVLTLAASTSCDGFGPSFGPSYGAGKHACELATNSELSPLFGAALLSGEPADADDTAQCHWSMDMTSEDFRGVEIDYSPTSEYHTWSTAVGKPYNGTVASYVPGIGDGAVMVVSPGETLLYIIDKSLSTTIFVGVSEPPAGVDAGKTEAQIARLVMPRVK